MFRECLVVVVEFCFSSKDIFVCDYNKYVAGMKRLEYFQSHGLVCVHACVSIPPSRQACSLLLSSPLLPHGD